MTTVSTVQTASAVKTVPPVPANYPKGKIVYSGPGVTVYENRHEEKAQTWAFSDLDNWV